jgi:hypothetical protein
VAVGWYVHNDAVDGHRRAAASVQVDGGNDPEAGEVALERWESHTDGIRVPPIDGDKVCESGGVDAECRTGVETGVGAIKSGRLAVFEEDV